MELPNILFIVVDCLRSDYYLKERGQSRTPFLDTVQKQGILFPNTITVTSYTTPSFSSLLTGLYPIEHGVRSLHNQKLGPNNRLLTDSLRNNGYTTYAFVTGPLFHEIGLARGFDEYEYRNFKQYLDSNWGDELKNRLKLKGFQEPWFMLLHLWELHQPRHSLLDKWILKFGESSYTSALSSLDKQLEQVWKSASEAGSRPLVGGLTGDHGEWVETTVLEGITRRALSRFRQLTMRNVPKANWHGYHVYDYLVRVPFNIWGKGLDQLGRVVNDQIRQLDILPTLLDMVGIAPPDDISGESLWPIVHDIDIDEKPSFMEASGSPSLLKTKDWLIGVRYKGWKYIYSPDNPDKGSELYDLNKDPGEKNNLSGRYPRQEAELRTLIESQYLKTDDNKSYTPEETQILEDRLRDLGYF